MYMIFIRILSTLKVLGYIHVAVCLNVTMIVKGLYYTWIAVCRMSKANSFESPPKSNRMNFSNSAP